MKDLVIRRAEWPADASVVASLFRQYATSIGIDLSFQGFEEELAGLPGKYSEAAGGCVLLAWRDEEPLGVVALRPAPESPGGEVPPDTTKRVCEMKRLYVRPEGRGCGLGFALACAICVAATEAGYTSICLDTLPSMAPALAVYAKLGFVPTAPYVYNPIEGALFLARDLTAALPAE